MNTNGAYLARRMREIGGDVTLQAVLPDRVDEIASGIHEALRRADIVLLVGGLGPTDDDLTREGLARASGRPLVTDPAALGSVEAFFRERKFRMPPKNTRQALAPEGSRILPNRRGTAPGIFLEWEEGAAACLPGPPIETEEVFEVALLPLIRDRIDSVRQVLWLRFAGIGESALVEKLEGLMGEGNPSLFPYAKRGEVHLRLAAEGESDSQVSQLIARRRRDIEERVGRHLYATGATTFEEAILEGLRERGESVATQESATGGWLSMRLTAPAGASDVYRGGTVVYTSAAKCALGGLTENEIASSGTVSAATAERLASQIRQKLGATWGLATVGWAGPSGDGPIGTGYVALAGPRDTVVEEVRYPGLREDVRFRITQEALVTLWRHTKREGLSR